MLWLYQNYFQLKVSYPCYLVLATRNSIIATLPKTLENMQVQGNNCPGTKIALDLMLIQFEVSYDMGKQTIEGPKK
jgi:hypothetical protein